MNETTATALLGDGLAHECPYPGPAAFDTDQAGLFYGRERTTADLLDRLDASRFDGHPVVVLAPPGAGKSSVLRAGLIPQLVEECVVFTPGADPLGAFAAALGVELADSPAETWRRVGRELIVVVDQLEELFTRCTSPGDRRGFIDLLAAKPSTVLIVLGLRTGYRAESAALPWLRAAVGRDPVRLGAMDESDLREAIVQPLRADHMTAEPRLVELLLQDFGATSDTGYDPGRLPLLADTLRTCWQHRDGERLTVDGYRAAGSALTA